MACKQSFHTKLLPSNGTPASENCNPNITHGSQKRNRPGGAMAGTASPQMNDKLSKHSNTCYAIDSHLISPPRKQICSSRRSNTFENPKYAAQLQSSCGRVSLPTAEIRSQIALQDDTRIRHQMLSKENYTEAGNESRSTYGCHNSEIKQQTSQLNEPSLSKRNNNEPLAVSVDQHSSSPRLMNEIHSMAACYAAMDEQNGMKQQVDAVSITSDSVEASPTLDQTGNTRLNSLLEAFKNLSPSREGRVKTLVRAFENLKSSLIERDLDEEQQRGRGDFQLQFTYLGSNTKFDNRGKLCQEQDAGGFFQEGGGQSIEGASMEGQEGKGNRLSEAGCISAQPDLDSGDFCEPKSAKGLNCINKGRLQQHHFHRVSVGQSTGFLTTRKSICCNNYNVSKDSSEYSPKPTSHKANRLQAAELSRSFSKPLPFKLRTEERGSMKEQEFVASLRKMLDEEERLRIPLAQGLPWTTDEPEIPYKPPAKDSTKPLNFQLHSELRAVDRSEFDHFILEKLSFLEQRRKEQDQLWKIREEEEIKKMRHEMVPKAQLMPYFDRPFCPQRSSKRPTVPKEPQFHYTKQPKRPKCLPTTD